MLGKKIGCIISVLALFVCLGISNVSAKSNANAVLAHWKLQNDTAYYTGDVTTDELIFTDLSGNGNHLQVGVEGKGAALDIFSWDKGCNRRTLKESSSSTSLLFDNSFVKAQSVDPYDSTQTAYSGAYVSGKYLHTVKNAPLNAFNGKGGWTIEVIFKVSPNWSNAYNRYTGIFSRQGVVTESNEPALSLAMSEGTKLEGDMQLLGSDGRVGLQYIFVDAEKSKTNREFADGAIKAGMWCHYMVTSKGDQTRVYINGQEVLKSFHNEELFMVNDSFGWEVGVGRKLKGNEATMNEEHPEGLIRRLFCGSISEIRFSSGVVDTRDSLLFVADAPTTTSTLKTTSSTTSIKSTTVTTAGPTTTVKTDVTVTQDTTTASQTVTDTSTTGASGSSITVGDDATAQTTSAATTLPAAESGGENRSLSGGIWIAVAAVVVIATVAVVLLIILKKSDKKL